MCDGTGRHWAAFTSRSWPPASNHACTADGGNTKSPAALRMTCIPSCAAVRRMPALAIWPSCDGSRHTAARLGQPAARNAAGRLVFVPAVADAWLRAGGRERLERAAQ